MSSVTVTLVSGSQNISIINDNIRYVVPSGSGSVIYTDDDEVHLVTQSPSSISASVANLAQFTLQDSTSIYVNPRYISSVSSFGSGAALSISKGRTKGWELKSGSGNTLSRASSGGDSRLDGVS